MADLQGIPRGRRSRRSSLNLNLSLISPMSTNTIGGDDDDAEHDEKDLLEFRSSYLQQRSSTPSTPSILSRAPSAHKRSRSHKSFAALPLTTTASTYNPYYSQSTNSSVTPNAQQTYIDYQETIKIIPKSKSSSYLVTDDYRHRRRDNDSEWMHRAGITLSNEARESKGQAWLLSRASSTNLVDSDVEDGTEAAVGGGGGNSQLALPHLTKSKTTASARSSGTRISELDRRRASLPANIFNPADAARFEPEFIDDTFLNDDFDDVDEEELHWSNQQRSGLGAWVDRLMGWTLFSMKEEAEEDEEADDDDDDNDNEDEVEDARLHDVQADNGSNNNTSISVTRTKKPRRKHRGDMNKINFRMAEDVAAAEARLKQKEREDAGWQDAAWMFAIATKVLF